MDEELMQNEEREAELTEPFTVHLKAEAKLLSEE
jgi:hypothetical protein